MKTEQTKPARKRGTRFATGVGPQRYARRDPYPEIPFQEMDARDKLAAYAIAFAAITILTLDLLHWWGVI